MFQNKILFNQSSVSFEIIGLPDLSNNENKDQISIISQWKLMIKDKPLIEGNIDHLSLIMDAFYSYSYSLINEKITFYESKLIDIRSDNFYTHNIFLKSSKPNVEPLNLIIGNSVLSDIINCFDQFNHSDKVRNTNLTIMNVKSKNDIFNFSAKKIMKNILLTPFISLCSLFFVSSTFIYFYNLDFDKDNKELLN